MRRLRTPCVMAVVLSILLPVAAAARSQKEEVEVGRKAMLGFRKTGFVREAPLTQVGGVLKQYVDRKDLPWSFFVLEDHKSLNAFALPGGFVFVTRLYYEKLTVDELAFVVGHEMTHIDEKHSEQSVKRARTAQIADLLASIFASRSGNRALGTVADLGTKAYYTTYSRKLEREADLGGFTLSKQAGFDPNAGVTALGKLGKDKSDPITANIFATHPILSSREDRLAALEKSSTITPASRPNIQKSADPNWKPVVVPQEALTARSGVAVRIVGDDGALWDRKWRAGVRRLLSERIRLAGRLDVRGDRRADGKDSPDLAALRRDDKVSWLVVVTVHQMTSDAAPATTDGVFPTTAVVRLSARAVNTATGEAKTLADVAETLNGTDVLPLDGAELYADMTITEAVGRACDTLVGRMSELR